MQAGILSYKGPKTCLSCHEEIMVQDAVTGKVERVDLMKNLLSSAHYRFYTSKHPNVYGFNGKLADNFAMGKINRPCPKHGWHQPLQKKSTNGTSTDGLTSLSQ